MKSKEKNVVLPKTRQYDETLHRTQPIPSVAAIVPAEVPSFKKTILGLRQDRTDMRRDSVGTRVGFDRPTKSTVERHYKFHPTKQQITSYILQNNNKMEGISESHIPLTWNHKRNNNMILAGKKSVDGGKKGENGIRRFLLQLSPDTISIIPKSRNIQVHPTHVTGESRRRIHKHKGKNSDDVDHSKAHLEANVNGGAFDAYHRMRSASLFPLGSSVNYGPFGLSSVPLPNSKINALYHQQLQSNIKPILDFTAQNSAYLAVLPVSPDRTISNSLKLLGSGAKRWERNRFNRKKERYYHHNETEDHHRHNETEDYHHAFGKIR